MRWWISFVTCAAVASAAGPVDFGKAELDAAMGARNIKYKPRIMTELNLDPPETFRIEPYTAGGAHITGGDLRGLMYGLLEAAQQMRATGKLKLSHGVPAASLRGVRLQARLETEWFRADEFWRSYFAQLAQARFDRLQLVFERLPERELFPAIRAISQSAAQYGIDIAVGLEAFPDGSAAGVRAFLSECPLIHSVVFDTQGESPDVSALFQVLQDAGRRVILQVRDDESAASPIEAAGLEGVPLRHMIAFGASSFSHDSYWRLDAPVPSEPNAISAAIMNLGAGFEIPSPQPDNGWPDLQALAAWGRLGYDPKPEPAPQPARRLK